MLLNKKGNELENFADETIQPWGIKHNKVRKVSDDKNEETHRTACRRQRDRILYSGGFRRLQDKTQVLAATKSGDHRTRLTHTMEVEQIAVSLADAFGLNRDLVAAIALGHDVGHTPFGHAVERYLDKKLKKYGHGGFSHALQSVRYFNDKKIKLSDDIIEGIIKHDTDVYLGVCDNEQFGNEQFDLGKYKPHKPGSLEAQVVYWADKIAYITHDLEDFITSGIYSNAIHQQFDLEEDLLSVIDELILVCEKKINFKNDIDDKYNKIRESFDKFSNSVEKDCNETTFELKIIDTRISEIQDFIQVCMKSHGVRKYKKELLSKVNSLNAIVKYSKINDVQKFCQFVNEFKYFLEKNELTINNLEIRDYIRPILDNLIENSIKNLNGIADELQSKSVVEITCNRIEAEENVEKLKEKLKNLDSKTVKKLSKKCYQRGLLITFDKEYYKHYSKLRELVTKHYIFSPEISRSDAKAEKIAGELFDRFMENEKILPLSIKRKLENEESKERVIADYIASMTDKYAKEVYNDLSAIASHYEY